jgi:hypothetical protein
MFGHKLLVKASQISSEVTETEQKRRFNNMSYRRYKNTARQRHSLQTTAMNHTAINVTTDDVQREAPVSSTRQHGVLHNKTDIFAAVLSATTSTAVLLSLRRAPPSCMTPCRPGSSHLTTPHSCSFQLSEQSHAIGTHSTALTERLWMTDDLNTIWRGGGGPCLSQHDDRQLRVGASN